MTNLLNLQLPRFSPNNDSPTKSPSLKKERKAFQLPMFRKLYIERRLKNKGEQKDLRQFSSVNSSRDFPSSDDFSSDLTPPTLDDFPSKQQLNSRPGMARRSSSLRLLTKPSALQDEAVECFQTTMPRRRSSVRIAKHMGSSRKLLCRMTSQDELIVKPHQADGVEDVSYIQLEIVPTSPRKPVDRRYHDGLDDEEDCSDDDEEEENYDDDDSDDLSTASDPMCYLPVRAKQRQSSSDESVDFEKNYKSMSAFSKLAFLLNSNNNSQSEASKPLCHHEAQSHC